MKIDNHKKNRIKTQKDTKNKNLDSKIRFNVLSLITYLFGMIILSRLFSLQIINGAEYRENSNTRLSRETTIDSTRGSILDRNGTSLVNAQMTFSLEMYKSKANDKSLNSSIALMTGILQANGDSYVDHFPISIDPFAFNFSSEEELIEWKKEYKIPETASAEEAFYLFRDKYSIESEDISEIRRILAIRYEITTKGYSATTSLAISKTISRNSAIQLQENSLDLTGVNVVINTDRAYNMGNLASHIIGYMGRISDSDKDRLKSSGDSHKYESSDKIGKFGIERVFEKYLRGTDGIKQIDMDVNGTITGEYVTQEALGGSDIVLTIDANLQRVTEESLANCIAGIQNGAYGSAYNATGGAAVVVDVNTGEILAMASNPDYTPQVLYDGISNEQYADYDSRNVWSNKAIQGTYQPGSTFKMATAIAGLETGAINPSERINDTGTYPLNPNGVQNPKCWYFTSYGRGHGLLNVTEALAKSCNYYFYETGLRTGIDTLSQYAKHFGLGKKTGVELNGEKAGLVAARDTQDYWSAADTIRAAIGQSNNNFTPLQMAKYIAMVCNGGKNIDVTIVKNILNSDGSSVTREEINAFSNNELNLTSTSSEDDGLVINPDTFAIVKEGMRSVVEEGGTAYSYFKDFDVEVGGKTGSAEAGNDIVNALFAGFAPYDNPQIAIVVVVENGGHGSYTADVVRTIMHEYFGMNTDTVTENMSIQTEIEYLN